MEDLLIRLITWILYAPAWQFYVAFVAAVIALILLAKKNYMLAVAILFAVGIGMFAAIVQTFYNEIVKVTL